MPLVQALAWLLLVATGAVDKEIGWVPAHNDHDDHDHDHDNFGDHDHDDFDDHDHNFDIRSQVYEAFFFVMVF